ARSLVLGRTKRLIGRGEGMALHIGRHIAALSVAAAAMVATAATGFAETPLERGTYLMNSIVACGNCHTPKGPNGKAIESKELSGRVPVDGAVFPAAPPKHPAEKETRHGNWAG